MKPCGNRRERPILAGRRLPPALSMGWKLPIQGMPEGYFVEEGEDGLTLRAHRGRVVAEFGPMVSSLDSIVKVAWEDAGPPAPHTRLTTLPQAC